MATLKERFENHLCHRNNGMSFVLVKEFSDANTSPQVKLWLGGKGDQHLLLYIRTTTKVQTVCTALEFTEIVKEAFSGRYDSIAMVPGDDLNCMIQVNF